MYLFKSFLKITILLLVLGFTTSTLFAQVTGRPKPKIGEENTISPYGKIIAKWFKLQWFIEGNFGTRLLGATSTSVDLSPGFNTNLSLGYLTSDRFGIKGRYDFSSFKFTPGLNGQDQSIGRMHSVSLEAVTDLIPLIKGSKIRDWRIGLHGGFGLSTYRNVEYKEFREEEIGPWKDPFIKGNDDMGHVIIGIMPQYHISGRWSVNIDLSSFILIKQSRTFDQFSNVKFSGIGHVTSASLGFTFRP